MLRPYTMLCRSLSHKDMRGLRSNIFGNFDEALCHQCAQDRRHSRSVEARAASGRRAVLSQLAILVGFTEVVFPWTSVASEVDSEKKQLKLSIEEIKVRRKALSFYS